VRFAEEAAHIMLGGREHRAIVGAPRGHASCQAPRAKGDSGALLASIPGPLHTGDEKTRN